WDTTCARSSHWVAPGPRPRPSWPSARHDLCTPPRADRLRRGGLLLRGQLAGRRQLPAPMRPHPIRRVSPDLRLEYVRKARRENLRVQALTGRSHRMERHLIAATTRAAHGREERRIAGHAADLARSRIEGRCAAEKSQPMTAAAGGWNLIGHDRNRMHFTATARH